MVLPKFWRVARWLFSASVSRETFSSSKPMNRRIKGVGLSRSRGYSAENGMQGTWDIPGRTSNPDVGETLLNKVF